MPDFAEIAETFIFGMIGTLMLSILGAIIFAVVKAPWIIAATIGLCTIVYVVGWCLKNGDRFIEMFYGVEQEVKEAPPVKEYGISVLDGLERFEKKYNLSTVKFIWFVSQEFMPHGMNNLDYLEWIALTNELSSVTMNKKKGGK